MTLEMMKKLKIDETSKLVVLHGADETYFDEDKIERNEPSEAVDQIMLFTRDSKMLKAEVFKIVEKDLLTTNGKLFIAYPKKGNKRFESFVSRDEIHSLLEMDSERYVGGSAYKFNQLMSLDETYSLMVLKKVDKTKTKKIDQSQRVCQYTDLLPTLEEALQKDQEAYTFFQSLTPGYKNAWARYIYSAKQEITKEKRLNETIELLKKGVKTKK